MPPAPSSTIKRSASARAAPISVPPSILSAEIETLSAVEIVDNLLSAIEPANWALVMVPERLLVG